MISFQKVPTPDGGHATQFTLTIDQFTETDWLYLLDNQLSLIYHASFNEGGYEETDMLGLMRSGARFAKNLLPNAELLEGIWTADATDETGTERAAEKRRLMRRLQKEVEQIASDEGYGADRDFVQFKDLFILLEGYSKKTDSWDLLNDPDLFANLRTKTQAVEKEVGEMSVSHSSMTPKQAKPKTRKPRTDDQLPGEVSKINQT